MKTFIGEYSINPTTICDELIEFFEANIDRTQEGHSRDRVNKDVKDSIDLTVNLNDNEIPIISYAYAMNDCLQEYLKEYTRANEVERFTIQKNIFNIQKYNPGGGFKTWHHENGGMPNSVGRHLVFMTYLNDVEDGGTEFEYQNIKTQAVKGKTLFWPAGWTHTHRGVISHTQTKYIATGWFSFEEFQGI